MTELFDTQYALFKAEFSDADYPAIENHDVLPAGAATCIHKDMRIRELEMDREILMKTIACARMVIEKQSTAAYIDDNVKVVVDFMWER